MLADDLKALKVADLRRILTTAHTAAPARATKADLVARILDSKDAQDAYLALYPQQQPPPPVAVAAPAPAPLPQSTETPPPPPPQKDASLPPEDSELEKRKARAARFGIPLVNDDSDKLKARAQRFGTAAASNVDAEELEKRQRRAARFGTNPPAAS